MAKVIALASPVFFLLMALEWWWSHRVARTPATPANNLAGGQAVGYRLNDTIANLSLGMASQMVNLVSKGVMVFFYGLVFHHLALVDAPAFWNSWYGLILALILYDFCYYWLHRLGHEMGVLWAAHVVHHQSQTFNLSTALRQTSSGFLLSWIFYLPMALLGVPPQVFAIVALIDLLYQFWVHTEYVGKLGWFDRWFCSPSNHRVHHAVNTQYLDKNYGGLLIIWDRLFGTFIEEDERCIYGTRSPLESWDPLWANLEVYAGLWRLSAAAPRWRDKLLVWFKHPGWVPPGLPAGFGQKTAFRMEDVRTFDPPMTRTQLLFSVGLYLLLLGATVVMLEASAVMAFGPTAGAALAVVVGLWALGAAMQGRITPGLAALVQLASLATVSSELGWQTWHWYFKPLVMATAIVWVVARYRTAESAGTSLSSGWTVGRLWLLVTAFCFSLVGDVFLMLPPQTYFIPGLASFLVAHLFYIALFRSDVNTAPWFPWRRALAGAALAMLVMLGIVLPRLNDPILLVAVPAYALVIGLMAAQALGRAHVLGTPAAWRVGVGASVFVVSDAFIAINKFVSPLPMSATLILGLYYLAQLLIAEGALDSAQRAAKNRS